MKAIPLTDKEIEEAEAMWKRFEYVPDKKHKVRKVKNDRKKKD